MPTPTRYGDLAGNYSSLVEELSRGKITGFTPCHLDPDLDASLLPRLPDWRASLGQTAAAQAHLSNMGVAKGDLFLFWGLFRHVIGRKQWTFVGPPEHRLFGWLQVRDILNLGANGSWVLQSRPWLRDHPHVRDGWGPQNTLYIAAKRLRLTNSDIRLPGWGVFPKGLRLTAEGRSPSIWSIPDWLNPARGGVGMSYHPDYRWSPDGTLRCTGRGQEFVAAIDGRSDAQNWLNAIFEALK
jgi:hypothetical protein